MMVLQKICRQLRVLSSVSTDQDKDSSTIYGWPLYDIHMDGSILYRPVHPR